MMRIFARVTLFKSYRIGNGGGSVGCRSSSLLLLCFFSPDWIWCQNEHVHFNHSNTRILRRLCKVGCSSRKSYCAKDEIVVAEGIPSKIVGGFIDWKYPRWNIQYRKSNRIIPNLPISSAFSDMNINRNFLVEFHGSLQAWQRMLNGI